MFSLSYSNMKGSEVEQIRADTSDLPWSPRMTLLEFCIRFVLGRAVEAILSSILAVVFGGYERSNVAQRFFSAPPASNHPELEQSETAANIMRSYHYITRLTGSFLAARK